MSINELDVGGAEKAFVRIAVGLRKRGWEVQVISIRDAGALTGALDEAGISVLALGCGGFADCRAVWRMKKALAKWRPDVLLTFLHQANIAGRLAGRLAGIPRVISGIRVADRRWSVSITERMTSGFVDRYVAVSHAIAKVHADICGIAADRFVVIPNGVDNAAIRQTLPADRKDLKCGSDDTIIISVGRLSPQKAPLDLLTAFEFLKSGRDDGARPMKLLFAGDGPLRPALERQIAAKSLQDSVYLLGWRSDVWSLMKAADVMVLASHWEGLPNVILEAQAAGLPVVASGVDGCLELIRDMQNGRLFPCGQTEVLARILAEVIDRPLEAASMAATARLEVETRFTWDACIEQFHSLLTGVESL